MIPQGVIPLGGDSPGGRFPKGKDPPGEKTPRGLMVGDAALGSWRSRVRIPPPPSPNFGQIMAQMLFGRFGLQNKDLGPSFGAIDIIFRAGSVPMGPGGWGVGPRCAPLETQGEEGSGGEGAKPPSPPAAGHPRKRGRRHRR